mmetsp:Transcript_52125/g.113677  ORF Transcript_52125/g.113677 Transcript_52125/m.113677 type:complete len:214 (+) Transcript_52125:763-1404(+)
METTFRSPVENTSIRVIDAWRRWKSCQACAARSIGTPAARMSMYKMILLCATMIRTSESPASGAARSRLKTSSARKGFSVGSVSRSKSAFHTSSSWIWMGSLAAVSLARLLVLCSRARFIGSFPAANSLLMKQAVSSACLWPCIVSSFNSSLSPSWQHWPWRSIKMMRRPGAAAGALAALGALSVSVEVVEAAVEEVLAPVESPAGPAGFRTM